MIAVRGVLCTRGSIGSLELDITAEPDSADAFVAPLIGEMGSSATPGVGRGQSKTPSACAASCRLSSLISDSSSKDRLEGRGCSAKEKGREEKMEQFSPALSRSSEFGFNLTFQAEPLTS